MFWDRPAAPAAPRGRRGTPEIRAAEVRAPRRVVELVWAHVPLFGCRVPRTRERHVGGADEHEVGPAGAWWGPRSGISFCRCPGARDAPGDRARGAGSGRGRRPRRSPGSWRRAGRGAGRAFEPRGRRRQGDPGVGGVPASGQTRPARRERAPGSPGVVRATGCGDSQGSAVVLPARPGRPRPGRGRPDRSRPATAPGAGGPARGAQESRRAPATTRRALSIISPRRSGGAGGARR